MDSIASPISLGSTRRAGGGGGAGGDGFLGASRSSTFAPVQPSTAELRRRIDEEASAADELEGRLEVLGRDLAVLTGTATHLKRKRQMSHDPLLKAIAAAQAQLDALRAETALIDEQLRVDETRVKIYRDAQRSRAVRYTETFELRTETEDDRRLADAVVAEMQASQQLAASLAASTALAEALGADATKNAAPASPKVQSGASFVNMKPPPVPPSSSGPQAGAAPRRRRLAPSATGDVAAKRRTRSKSDAPPTATTATTTTTVGSAKDSGRPVRKTRRSVVGVGGTATSKHTSTKPSPQSVQGSTPQHLLTTTGLQTISPAATPPSPAGVPPNAVALPDSAANSVRRKHRVNGESSVRRRRSTAPLTSLAASDAVMAVQPVTMAVPVEEVVDVAPPPPPEEPAYVLENEDPAAGVPASLRFDHARALPFVVQQTVTLYECGAIGVDDPRTQEAARAARCRPVETDLRSVEAQIFATAQCDVEEYEAIVKHRETLRDDVYAIRDHCAHQQMPKPDPTARLGQPPSRLGTPKEVPLLDALHSLPSAPVLIPFTAASVRSSEGIEPVSALTATQNRPARRPIERSEFLRTAFDVKVDPSRRHAHVSPRGRLDPLPACSPSSVAPRAPPQAAKAPSASTAGAQQRLLARYAASASRYA